MVEHSPKYCAAVQSEEPGGRVYQREQGQGHHTIDRVKETEAWIIIQASANDLPIEDETVPSSRTAPTHYRTQSHDRAKTHKTVRGFIGPLH